MNFPRLKKSETPITVLSVYMSSKARSINHYETLNVSESATQEEIKSAYYKLTKQYHPDVNKTDDAKEKFREISDAYAVIGNYKIRRQYDKGMFARGTTIRSAKKDEKEPKHMAFYKSRMASYPKPIVTANTKMYDFDAWTRAHYGDTLKKTILRNEYNKDIEKERVDFDAQKIQASKELSAYVAVTMIFVLAIFFVGQTENYDVPSEERSEETRSR